MSHKAALQTLIPVALGGVLDADLTVEGAELDRAQADIEALRQAILSASVPVLPPTDDLIRMAPARGDIKKPHYLAVAAALGFTLRIEDYIPPIIGFFAVGDELNFEPWQDFSAAVSGAGDTLGMDTVPALLPACWRVIVLAGPLIPSPPLETMLLDLAPAHIKMNFIYL